MALVQLKEALGVYSAEDRNWRIFLNKNVIRYAGISRVYLWSMGTKHCPSQLIGVDKINYIFCDAVMKITQPRPITLQ